MTHLMRCPKTTQTRGNRLDSVKLKSAASSKRLPPRHQYFFPLKRKPSPALLQIGGGAMYSQSQDDNLLQPILVYLPLLAHGSGDGGVASSERLLKDFS